ncbi:probable serine carboxypeptidase CPVL [Biomphalaria glabrata]|uniref:Probable serine carboxypeptidase CPVL n=1 Tax=Biomphalaria glabrata TaxID=6526 RepID=A0A9U8E7V0_BIOGL|nr:probable serine carboxypeptidase CPVL [Biomphalaria glabrata]
MRTPLSRDSILLILIISLFNGVANQPLHLTPYLEQGNIETARKLSLVDDLTKVIPTSYSGFLTVDQLLKNHLWFWFIPAMNSDPKAPLVIWLTGGPGCSSVLNMFYGNGPLKLTKDSIGKDAYERRINSWAQTFSMLYIDNVVGVGYSHSDSGKRGIKTSKNDYTQHLYDFTQQFYVMFPEMKQNDLYIGGSGFALKYAASVAYKIHEDIQANRSNILLKGVYAGSPLIDAKTQLRHFFQYYYSLGIITNKELVEYTRETETILVRNEKTQVLDISFLVYTLSNLSLENINTFAWSPDVEIGNIMSADTMKFLLHVGNNTFELCSSDVYSQSALDFYLPLPELELVTLLDNYKVLFYTGVFDGVISSPGLEAVLMATPWSMQSAYNAARRTLWRDDDTVKGYYTHVGHLCRVVLHNAGMYMSNDQPENTVHMMEEFFQYGCILNTSH